MFIPVQQTDLLVAQLEGLDVLAQQPRVVLQQVLGPRVVEHHVGNVVGIDRYLAAQGLDASAARAQNSHQPLIPEQKSPLAIR